MLNIVKMVLRWTCASALLLLFIVSLGVVFSMICFGGEESVNEPVIIPKTTKSINAVVLYDRGQLAYIPDEENKTAELYVGNDDGNAFVITDPSCLRSVVKEEISSDKFSVVISDSVVCPSNGWYEAYSMHTGQTQNAWIRIYPTGNINIDEVKCKQDSRNISWVGTIGSPSIIRNGWELNTNKHEYIEYNFVGSAHTNAQEDAIMIGDFKCYSIIPYTKNNLNDLRTHDFRLRDDLGVFSFNNLRTQLLNKYNGNRGEDWSSYIADSVVKVNSNFVNLDGNDNYKVRSSEGKFTFYGNNQEVMTVSMNPDADTQTFKCTEVKIISVQVDNDTDEFVYDVVFNGTDFENGVEKINWNQVSALYTASLDPNEKNWVPIEFTRDNRAQATDGSWYYRFRSPTNGRNKGFYKVIASGVSSAAFTIDFNLPVRINNGLILKGEDNKFYKIKVNNGVISAEEIAQ